MKRSTNYSVVFTLCWAIVVLVCAASANAQCNTCATPVVAFSPVVAPATTVTTLQPVDTGWYPGKLLDTWRMRRWGYTAPTTVATTAAPTWTTAMPVTAAMPVTTMMPVTSTAVVQTANFAPVATTSFATPHITSFAPLGQRQVLMRPVVVQSPVIAASPVISAGCSTCSACDVAAPCSSCVGSTGLDQATYAAAPAPCAGCATGSTITYADQAPAAAGQTSQPSLTPQEAAPLRSNYPDVTPPETTNQKDNTQQLDPGPAAEEKASDSSTYFEAPALFIPGDRTAQQPAVKPANRAPTVDVWNAVYRGPAGGELSRTSYKADTRTQAEIDAEGWSSVPAN